MPSNETTTKFKVDISDLKKAMQEAKRVVAVANSEFKATSTAMDKWQKTTGGLKAKLTQLDTTLEAQKRMLAVLEHEYNQLSDEEKQNSKVADELRIKMNNQQAAINKTEKSITYYSNELDKAEKSEEIAARTGQKATDVFDELGREAKNSGDNIEKAGDGFTVFKGVLANLVTQGIDLALDKLRDLGTVILDTAEKVDDLNTKSKVTGIDVTTLQEWEYASKFIDTSVDTMTGAMGKLTKNMTSSSSSVTEAFDKLGVSTTNADGSLRDANAVFFDTIDALGKVTNETERDNLAMRIFGKSARELNPLIEAGSDQLRAYGNEAEELGLIMDKSQIQKYQELNDAVDKIKSIGTGWIYDIGSAFLSGIDIDAVVTKFENFGKAVAKVIKVIDLLNPVLAGLGVALAGVGIAGFIANLSTILPKLLLWAKSTSLVTAAQWLLNTAMSMNPIGLIIIGVTALITALAVLIKKNEAVRNFIIKTFGTIVNFFKTNWKSLLLTLINPFAGLFLFLYNNSTKFREFVDNAVATIQELPQAIAGWLTKTISRVSSFVTNLANKGKQAGTKLVTNVTNAVKKLPNKIKSIGGEVVTGIWNGIANKNAWIKSKIKSWVGDVTSWLKKFFKIGSPSRLMAEEIGKWIPAGIGMGIDDNMGSLYGAMQNMSSQALDGLSSGANGINTGVVGGVVNNFNQVINSPRQLSRLEIYRQSKNLLGYVGGV